MLQIVEKLLWCNLKYVFIVVFFVICMLIIFCGIGYVVYIILLIIYDVVIKNNICLECLMVVSFIGVQMGIIVSLVLVVVVLLVVMLGNFIFNGKYLEFFDLLVIIILFMLLGILVIGIFSWFCGKDLDQDEVFQVFIVLLENCYYVYGDMVMLLDKKLLISNWIVMWIFLVFIVVVVLFGVFFELCLVFDGKLLLMVLVIQMFMLFFGVLIIIIIKINLVLIFKNEVFCLGMIVIVVVYGIVWMVEIMFGVYMIEIKGVFGEMVKEYLWVYVIVLLLVLKFVNFQVVVLVVIVLVVLVIGVDLVYIVVFVLVCYGYYILLIYLSDLVVIQFDCLGIIYIGCFVINYSFILFGFIGVGVFCVFGWVFVVMYGFL